MPRRKYYKNNESNFWDKICYKDTTEQGCWIFGGTLDKDGYGEIWYKGYKWRAHRLAYLFANKSINHDLLVCHSCDNPSCINPAHLKQGTATFNMEEKFLRNRHNCSGVNNSNAKYTKAQIQAILDYRKQGYTLAKVAQLVGCSESHVKNVIYSGQRKDVTCELST